MKKALILITILAAEVFCQSPAFYPSELWRVSGYGMAFNVEVHDINNDGKQDIIVGNWNDTYVYYGGAALLDSTVDITYTGRCLAVCDYNGDGYKDLITMHFTSYDTTRNDYNGEILFYYGSNTTPNIDTIPEYSIPLPTLYPFRDRLTVNANRPGIEYGDFNNDGKYDFVLNSENVIPKLSIGAIYIYMGDDIPPDTATFNVMGREEFNLPPIYYFGQYFQVGNINNDNYDDLILSSRVQTVPPGSQDSLDVLHIYLGSENFAFAENGESFIYESRLKNNNYSYGWFKREISMMDINGDGFGDIIISQYYKDSTNHIHYGSINVLDTIPSFIITDPDTTREDIIVGQTCHDVGDWNNDGYNDFLLKQSGIKSFTVQLGGPNINNRNPYGLKGLLEAFSTFPTKAIGCGDQNGDSIRDFVVTAYPYSQYNVGYVIIYKGRDDIVVSVKEKEIEMLPQQFNLEQNYPNPFNPITTIQFALRSKQFVTLIVYDLLGNEVTTLVNEEKPSGKHQIKFDAEKYKLSSGTYFYKLKTSQGELSRKMIYLK